MLIEISLQSNIKMLMVIEISLQFNIIMLMVIVASNKYSIGKSDLSSKQLKYASSNRNLFTE